MVQVLESYIKYCVCGTLYKFSLLDRPKLRKVWGSYHNVHLAHPILVIHMELKIRNFKVLQVTISDSEGVEIADIHHKEGHLGGQTTNQGFQRYVDLKLSLCLIGMSD
jgi:hypothetical protein